MIGKREREKERRRSLIIIWNNKPMIWCISKRNSVYPWLRLLVFIIIIVIIRILLTSPAAKRRTMVKETSVCLLDKSSKQVVLAFFFLKVNKRTIDNIEKAKKKMAYTITRYTSFTCIRTPVTIHYDRGTWEEKNSSDFCLNHHRARMKKSKWRTEEAFITLDIQMQLLLE